MDVFQHERHLLPILQHDRFLHAILGRSSPARQPTTFVRRPGKFHGKRFNFRKLHLPGTKELPARRIVESGYDGNDQLQQGQLGAS